MYHSLVPSLLTRRMPREASTYTSSKTMILSMALPAYALLVVFAVFNEGTFAQMKITACPNEELAIDCTSDSDHVWEGTALDCATILVFRTDEEGRMYPCGNTPVVKVEGGSRLNVTADSSLDGATVVCRTAETVVNATVEVLETVHHTITNIMMDVSDSSCVELEVTATSDPSMCFEEYIFSAVGVGSSTTVDSSSSTVFTGTVCGLCSPYCGYNYTVVGRPKYGEDVVAFKNSDSECLQLESMSVDESGRTVTLFLNDTIENMMCMTATVVPNGLDYTINDTDGSVTWMGFSYCTENYNFKLEFECCPDVTGSYDTSIEISLTSEVEYQCNAGIVNVNVTTDATGVDIVPDLDVTIKDQSGSAVGRNNITMVYQNYTADVVASIDLCNKERQDRFVPNVIVAHEVEFNETSANISVTYAECVDDTSEFMIRVVYGREGLAIQKNVVLPKQTFTLPNLISGTSYQYTIEVKNGVNRIGAAVEGTFTTSSPRGLSGGTIAGIIVAVVVIAIGIALIVVGIALLYHFCCKKGTKGCHCSSGEGGNTTDKEGIELKKSSDTDVGHSKTPWWKCCI